MNKERYKYTDIQSIENTFEQLPPATEPRCDIQAQPCLYSKHPTGGGYDLEIPARTSNHGVIEIDLHYPVEGRSEQRLGIKLGESSATRIVVRHHGGQMVRYKVSIEARRNSTLQLIEIAQTGATLLSTIEVGQMAGSRVGITTLDLNNQVVIRNQIVDLTEAQAECVINGLYITQGTEHVDNYIRMNHLAPHCSSNQLYKGILTNRSTAVFTGHIFVARNSQQTAAYQQNHNILLSDTALINTRPQLEIYADDVKCNHGATVGRMDPEAIFYMRQRGISLPVARKLQLVGFAEDVLRGDDAGGLHEIIRKLIEKRLEMLDAI